MLIRRASNLHHGHGFTLLEVLITVILLSFGLLGLATLQGKMQFAEMESYQRGQAIVLLTDMVQRMNANRANAASYVGGTLGTGDSQPTSCSGLAVGVNLDTCEWSNALKGAAEQKSGGGNVGAMIGAQGCITQLQAPNLAAGVCLPGKYRVIVVWQGLQPTVTPNLVCPGVAASSTVRSISSVLTVGLTTCV
jgi:type IV pilus assembly protein PilV